MTVDTSYAPALVVCCFDSWSDVQEHARWFEQMVTNGQLKAHTSALVDFRNVEPLRAKDWHTCGLAAGRDYPISPGRIAYVVRTFTQYLFIEEIKKWRSSTCHIRAFQDESNALDWLFPTIEFPTIFLH